MGSSPLPNWHWYYDYFGRTEIHLHGFNRFLFQKQTPYQTLEIIDSPAYGRMLLLDGDIQSSAADEYIYHEALVQPAMVTHPDPRRVLILGGGEGATLREALRHRTVEKVWMFDLDPEVLEACRTFLPEWSAGAFDDPRLTLRIGDARAMLEEYQGEPFDVILSDLTDPFTEGPSYRLFTREFFTLVKQRLAPDGIFALQSSILRNTSYQMHQVIHNTLKTVFDGTFSYAPYVPSLDTPWGFILASDRWQPMALDPLEVDRRLAERVEGELRWYDGETHLALFHLSKDLRRLLAQPSVLMEDDHPFFLPRKWNE
ncbi:MAG: fused MFS/spermidine synthase [Coprothermobacterota bacterium]|nr:fused MFS/spermidine synthase [Coprothermobacterota bacterium]